MAKSVEAASAPFQHALSTKAGRECVAHILRTLTDQDGQATVLSIDGIGAYDLISRSTMLEGLLKLDRADEILPLVRCFSGSPSTGMSHEIAQGEGGVQRDPLMPMLFALGLHPTLRAAQARMRVGEGIFAYLDEVYGWWRFSRSLRRRCLRTLRSGSYLGKTQVWKKAGVAPPGINSLTRSARVVKPDAIVWRRDASLPLESEDSGGCQLGSRHTSMEHETLFERIPQGGRHIGGLVAPVDVHVTKSNFLASVCPTQISLMSSRHNFCVH